MDFSIIDADASQYQASNFAAIVIDLSSLIYRFYQLQSNAITYGNILYLTIIELTLSPCVAVCVCGN